MSNFYLKQCQIYNANIIKMFNYINKKEKNNSVESEYSKLSSDSINGHFLHFFLFGRAETIRWTK